jgi:hypothetical protein
MASAPYHTRVARVTAANHMSGRNTKAVDSHGLAAEHRDSAKSGGRMRERWEPAGWGTILILCGIVLAGWMGSAAALTPTPSPASSPFPPADAP